VSTLRVFISYSHDSAAHRERVVGLSERLRADGIDARLDQYVNGTPPEKWYRWMLNQLDAAQFVLIVCTETYYRRFRGLEEPGKGKGADWEGAIITQEIYDVRSCTLKFVPVLFAPQDQSFIPEPLRGWTHYTPTSEEGYKTLYDFLLGQAGVEPSPLGELKPKPRRRSQPISFEDDAHQLTTGHSSAELFDAPDELSHLLAFSVPEREVFHRVAAALGAEPMRGSTPLDRWVQLVRWCVAHDREQRFAALMSSETPDVTTSRLRAMRLEIGPCLSLQDGRWQQRDWIEGALARLIRRHAGEHMGGVERLQAAAYDFTAWALEETWGGTPSLPPALQAIGRGDTKSSLSLRLQSGAMTEGWWVATRRFGWAPPELGIALSALHIVRTAEHSPEFSRELIDWIETHVTSLSQDQLEVVRLVAAWVPTVAERLEAILLATARGDRLRGKSGRTVLVELRKMVWALSYPPVGRASFDAETRAEVARRVMQAGFEDFVVDLLQLMGEDSVDRILAMLSAVRDFDCRVAILRMVRMLLLARPQPVSAGENIEIAALRASLPSAGAADFKAIHDDPRAVYLWLRLLDWPLPGSFTPWVEQVANKPSAPSQEMLVLCTRLLTPVQS